MLRLDSNAELFLVQPSDLVGEAIPEEIRDSLEPLRAIAAWAQEYLCQPHEELGRKGPVCPFVQASLRKCNFFLSIQKGRDYTVEKIESIIRSLRDWFLELEPISGPTMIFKTILCLFPDLPLESLPTLIDGTQARLKHEYVPHGLMVGEFHQIPPNKEGLWNPEFRPLYAPVPMLVIRNMVATDFPFLKDDRFLFEHFLERFGTEVPAHLRQDVAAAAAHWNVYFPDPNELPHVHPRVRAALEKHRVNARVHRHQDMPKPIRSPKDFADCLGVEEDRITKSLFLHNKSFRYVVAVVPAKASVDLKALATELGCGRLSLADPEELAAYLDYSPGGVSPLGVDEDIRVVVDSSLMGWPSILVAAGEIAVEVEVKPQDLVRMTGAEVRSLVVASSQVES